MRTERKDLIASKFLEWPVMHMLVRALLFSGLFRFCFLAFLTLPIILTLSLTKVWRTTPRNFQPVVRISGIDWLQARSLRQTALREIQNGNIRDGLISYNLALANNPASLPLIRGFLRQVLEHVEAPDFQGPALGQAFWLLRLTQTNSVDLELAANVFAKYGLDYYLITLLKAEPRRLSPPLQKIYLSALFNDGQFGEFDRYWRSPERAAELSADEELGLYRSAFGEGWGHPGSPERSGMSLQDYLQNPRWRVLANQLYLRVCEQRNDVDEYLNALGRLRGWEKNRVIDHVRGWRLLDANGRREEAIKYARDYSGLPITALETAQLAQAFFHLGLREAAEKLLDRFVLEFSFLDGLWVLYGDLLIASERWDKLRQVALSIRLDPDLRERLSDYSYYLEGRLELAKGANGNAETAFSKIGFQAVPNPELTLAIARGLQQLGQTEKARSLLTPLEVSNKQNPAYWETVIAVAYEAKDSPLLLRAATNAYRLNPKSWTAMNNYAAALLINRVDPHEAIQQTFQLIQLLPQNIPIRINHAWALAQNNRPAEADVALAAISPRDLGESERATYFFACIETLVIQNRFELARSFLQQLDSSYLFPMQKEYLNQKRDVLGNYMTDR